MKPPRSKTGWILGGLFLLAMLAAGMAVLGWYYFKGKGTLASAELSPAGGAQTVDCPGKISVTVPPGALAVPVPGSSATRRLEAPTTLTISAAEAPATGDDRLKVLSAYDIRLEDKLVVTEPLEIEIAYDPQSIPAGRRPEQALLAAWWNPLTETWGVVPAQVDAARGRVRIRATHLSVYGLILQWYDDVVQTDHFTICYSAKDIQGDVYASESAWAKRKREEGNQDPLGTAQPGYQGHIPTFIQDLGRMLEHSYRRYQLAGFRVPSTTWGRLTVFVYTSGYSNRGKLTGIVSITTITPRPAEYRLVVAHELFHVVQANYFQSWIPGYSKVGEMMAMNYRTWWLEAGAEYAAWQVAWQGACNVAKPQLKYLEDPLSLQDGHSNPQHMYQNAAFLKYLADQNVSFKELFEYTVDKTSAAYGMEAIGALNFTLNQLGFNKGPTEEWKTTVTLSQLENYFLSRKPELVDRYRAWAGHLLFDAGSPLAGVKSGDDLLTLVATFNTTFKGDQTEAKQEFRPGPHYTSQLWGVRIQTATPGGTRRLRAFVDKNMPSGTVADVYILRQNARQAGPLSPTGTMAANNITREVFLDLADGDAVYCLGLNRSRQAQSFTVKLDTGVKLSVASLAIPDGLPHQLYTFRAIAENVPPETTSVLLEWDFGDGSERVEDRKADSVSPACAFQYMHAYGREQLYTLKVRLYDTTRITRTLLAEVQVKLKIGKKLSLRIDPTTTVAEPGVDVPFEALTSGAPENAQYEWDFGDGTARSITRKAQVAHRYAKPGTYTVRVLLLDTDKPRPEGELAADEASAVIRKAGPVAIVAMRVQFHTGKATSMRRLKGSDTTSMSYDYDQEWEFSRVECQDLDFWGQGTSKVDEWTKNWRLKGRLTPDRKTVEFLELEESATREDDLSKDISTDRLLVRNIPAVRQGFDRVICEVKGPQCKQHAAVVESTFTREGKQASGHQFELDARDIDWEALDRSMSLTDPKPAYIRIEIIPKR